MWKARGERAVEVLRNALDVYRADRNDDLESKLLEAAIGAIEADDE